MEILNSIKQVSLNVLPQVILTVLIIAGLWYLGTSDYEDELHSEKMYCEMVKSGNWKDFNHNYDDICK